MITSFYFVNHPLHKLVEKFGIDTAVAYSSELPITIAVHYSGLSREWRKRKFRDVDSFTSYVLNGKLLNHSDI
jgi:hypothetical protein